jgi:hemerythrin-like metal-binding protein
MQLLKWEDRFSVGIREFDLHHKILFEMINSLILARENEHNQAAIGSTLEQLIQYTIFHFTAEESTMAYFGFEGLEAHKVEHAKLLEKVRTYQKDFKAGKKISIDDLLDFLAAWLLDHTLGIDQEYGPFLSHHIE